MKAARNLVVVAVLALVSACAAEQRPAPAPAPAPVRPVAPAAPPSVAAPPRLGWEDQPLSAGEWQLREDGSRVEASFGASPASLILRCNREQRQVQVIRPGVTSGNTMTLRTSDAQRSLPISIAQDGSAAPYAALAAEDPLLDSLVFSRGRFSVEVPGMDAVIAPAWPETARVVEDCRG